MATITPVTVDTTGAAVTYTAASGGGDTIANAAGATLRVKNGGVGSINVTLTGAKACSQGSTHDKVIAVAAAAEKAIKIPSQCVHTDTGACAVTYSGVTTVTVAATK